MPKKDRINTKDIESELIKSLANPLLENSLQRRSHNNSFVVRSRSSTHKQQFIKEYNNLLVIEPATAPSNWLGIFTSIKQRNLVTEDKGIIDRQLGDAKLVLEIGFGKGDMLIHNVLKRPQDLFIGIEVYPSGVYNVLKKIKKHKIDNIALVQHDAVTALNDMFEDGILDEIQVLFPDPWPKKRHHKRRMLSLEFITLMITKLKVGGLLHIATDWQDYAEGILSHIKQLETGYKDTKIKNPYPGYADGPQLGRPTTRFEQRGIDEEREIYEFLLKKL